MTRDPKLIRKPVKADCYSAGERSAMILWREIRATGLRPLLAAMTRTGARPDHLTFLAAAAGAAANNEQPAERVFR